jgi:hypothetical protein
MPRPYLERHRAMEMRGPPLECGCSAGEQETPGRRPSGEPGARELCARVLLRHIATLGSMHHIATRDYVRHIATFGNVCHTVTSEYACISHRGAMVGHIVMTSLCAYHCT